MMSRSGRPKSRDKRTKYIRYERNENSRVEFMFVTDLSEFNSDNIEINHIGYEVSIRAVQYAGPEDRRIVVEYHDNVLLPRNVDPMEKLVGSMGDDGNLTLRIPIKPNFISSSAYKPSPVPTEERSFYEEKIVIDRDFSNDDVRIEVSGKMIFIEASVVLKNANGDSIEKTFQQKCYFPFKVNREDVRMDVLDGMLTLSAFNRLQSGSQPGSNYDSLHGSLRSNKTGYSSNSDIFQFRE